MEISYTSSTTSDFALSVGRQVKVIPLRHPDVSSSSLPSSPPQSPLSFLLPARFRRKVKYMTSVDWVELFLPCTGWIRAYKWREYLQVDLMAGITVGIMLVPQSMSYGKLVGLQPIYRLYSGFVAIFIYAIFGSSRQVAIGPVALTSLLDCLNGEFVRIGPNPKFPPLAFYHWYDGDGFDGDGFSMPTTHYSATDRIFWETFLSTR